MIVIKDRYQNLAKRQREKNQKDSKFAHVVIDAIEFDKTNKEVEEKHTKKLGTSNTIKSVAKPKKPTVKFSGLSRVVFLKNQ